MGKAPIAGRRGTVEPVSELIYSVISDSDRVLVLLLLILLYRQGADKILLAALLYIALDF